MRECGTHKECRRWGALDAAAVMALDASGRGLARGRGLAILVIVTTRCCCCTGAGRDGRAARARSVTRRAARHVKPK